MKIKKIILSVCLFSGLVFVVNAQTSNLEKYESTIVNPYMGIGYLKFFEKAYPDITFSKRYDVAKEDWIITVDVPDSPDNKDGEGRTAEFYWANGSFLPEEELINKDNYWSLLYSYSKELADPEKYTDEEKEAIREYSSKENRENGSGTPMFLFDFIYESNTRRSLETHIKRISFLGVKTNIHERIKEPLEIIDQKIKELSLIDSEVRDFLYQIKSADGYLWRIIDGTNRKSFHSLGLAIDVLPKNLGRKQIFWSWAKDKYPNDWMLVPLKDRWIPPQKVIEIFEENGFIWGGKWIIYDNMHFEYHPELIEYNFHRED